MGVQGKMIEAAARAGVKWILPTEYAGDGLNEGMVEAVPLFHPKREARRQSSDSPWLRARESPTKARCLLRSQRRNASGEKAGRSHRRGRHHQWRYPVSGRPCAIQFWPSLIVPQLVPL